MIYEYRGVRPEGISAEVAGAELTRIYRDGGGISPSAVVDAARAPDALLHPAFEWDNDEAAEKYREQQARQLVRSVVLVSDPAKGEQAPTIRAFISLTVPEEPRKRLYKPTMEALENPEEAEQIKRRLRNQLLSLRRQYMDLIDIGEMMQVVSEVMVA